MKKTGLHIAFLVLILLLALPAIQMKFRLFGERPLNGAFTLADKPVFSKEKWMNGSFQGETEIYLKDHSGFRNFLVRLQNQVDFTFFRQANAEGAVIGKNGQLFEYDYIRSWQAIDYPGDSFIEKKLQRAKWVQDYLKREKNIDLVIVFEPGKASFYPEYIPDKYSKRKSGASTYQRYRDKAEELNLDFIDFHRYFLQLKPAAKYPLYPRYGTHWSVYGMKFAADSLLSLIEIKRGLTLTGIKTDSVEISAKPLDTDDDVLKTMNLLFQPKGEKLAYPVMSFDTAHPGYKPMVLTIADSYYWNIFNTKIPKYLFANQAFWYFNTLVYPDHYLKPTYTKDLDFRQEVEKQQVIFLMVTERFVHKFDWRFIDQLYVVYTPDWLRDPVYDKINDVMQVGPWYSEVIIKADKKGISLEQALIEEGKYLYFNSDTARYMIDYGPEHYMKMISRDEQWMAQVREKAQKENKTVEQKLAEDALYMFRLNYPGLYDLNRERESIENLLHLNPVIFDSLRREAEKYRFDPEIYTRLISWKMLKEEEISKTTHAILTDTAWLGDVQKKALEKGISVEEMIRLDAEYMFEQKLKQF
jgi:hypothetical protein